ncbi:TonB family protein [Sessilibacter corallicola]|uniref:TonB family protein n=1 Tax=Sessilibacter corallicola TaxID=2904075 RepID=UPI00331305AB
MLSGCISNAIQPPPRPKPSLSYFIDPNTKVNWKKTVHAKPLYPRRELSKGIEGWVAVKYNISKSGITENISVIDSSPLSVFDKSAMGPLDNLSTLSMTMSLQLLKRHLQL